MKIEVGENAQLNHIKIQTESMKAFHISNTYVHQKSNSRYKNTAVSFGSRLSRNNINTTLDGEGIESILNGLYMAHADQHMDTHTLLDHAKPHCNSHELYRGILADQAKGVFSGKILVRQEAQKTDAVQSNNCILLSEDARIDSKPQLEIYADDVKCTHGATVGQLDENSLFYLRSRGIGAAKAKNILIYAFAEEVIEEIEFELVRQRIDQLILDRFSDDMAFSM
jgi:Fe-S cluster assembly protein SufD